MDPHDLRAAIPKAQLSAVEQTIDHEQTALLSIVDHLGFAVLRQDEQDRRRCARRGQRPQGRRPERRS